jgi:hypothetical protein
MRHGKTIVVEEIEKAGDIQEENEDLKIFHDKNFHKSATYRLSFFSEFISTKRGLTSVRDSAFLGYAVVKQDYVPGNGRHTRVYESVICKSNHPNNFVRGCPDWKTLVGNRLFGVAGYLYAQQNNATNVCAHVALRTAAGRFHPDGDLSYRQMNRLIGVDHVKRKVGGPKGTGLRSNEMETILEAAGSSCFVANYTLTNPDILPVPFQKCIYGSIESGYPALVAFRITAPAEMHHVIPLFGHTFNEDTWVPDADFSYFRIGKTRYVPSESWLSMFVGHDDNWGSNICIPRHYLQGVGKSNRRGSARNAFRRVDLVLGTFPKGVRIDAITAEAIARDYLSPLLELYAQKNTDWGRRLLHSLKTSRIVLRPVLLSLREYLQHLELLTDWSGNRVGNSIHRQVSQQATPETLVWMIEVSLPNLFPANRRKVGEVLLFSQKEITPERNFHSFILGRVFGDFVLRKDPKNLNSTFQLHTSSLASHVELYGCEEVQES